ncbi:MAG: MBL fold metallo-hydrolase [Steroidobacteraceae bacterium]
MLEATSQPAAPPARTDSLIIVALLALALAWQAAPARAQEAVAAGRDDAAQDRIIVTLLGTGTPDLSADRFGFSNLVQAGGLNLLFDAGRGTAIRLHQAGLHPGKLDAVFLTHFHSDHVSGLADVWLTGYIGNREQAFKAPMQLYGPRGTARIAQGLMFAFRADAQIRFGEEKDWRPGAHIEAHELSDSVVFEKNGVKVTAFTVDHGQGIEPCQGYRIDYSGRSVVIAGDTVYDKRVIAQSRNVDLLIHEAGYGAEGATLPPAARQILGHHTSPEDAGRVFASAAPKLAVFSHVVRLPVDGQLPSIGELIDRTRRTYGGPLWVGEDLMRFVVTDSIAVYSAESKAR